MNASQTVKLSIHVPGNSHLHWAPRGEQGSALLKIHAMVLQYLPNPLIEYIVQHKLCSGFAQDKQYPAPPTSRSTLPVSSPFCVDSRNWESNCYPKTPPIRISSSARALGPQVQSPIYILLLSSAIFFVDRFQCILTRWKHATESRIGASSRYRLGKMSNILAIAIDFGTTRTGMWHLILAVLN